MMRNMDLEQRVAGLREYELFCYRIAYYVLEQERAATLAAQEALLELGNDRGFFLQPPQERQAWARKVAIKHALRCQSD